jgi:hypothetical protein
MKTQSKGMSIPELVELVHAAAQEAAEYQERFAAEDTEARKIVDIMEHFLREKGRVVYGGAAINAHMSPANKFYDPRLNLPDYDFLTPDPLQDCADLIVTFRREGFIDVEAKFGIHEGTYKIFVNFRAAADITYMPPEYYDRIESDAVLIDGIRYASENYLRMNMYLELSRPAGMVSRWEKVYERLLLLNAEHPLRVGRCVADPLGELAAPPSSKKQSSAAAATQVLHDRLVGAGIAAGAVFLSGASYLNDMEPRSDEVVMMMIPPAGMESLLEQLRAIGGSLKAHAHEAQGELLPARTELYKGRSLVAIVFETTACHSYTTLSEPAGYRLGSIDLLIQMYYALYFAELDNYLPVRLLCVIQELIEMEASRRRKALKEGTPAHDVFPLECLGHQPTMPELKKAHRERVREKREELAEALQVATSESIVKPSKKRRRTQRTKLRL